jgi:hypothetical protein
MYVFAFSWQASLARRRDRSFYKVRINRVKLLQELLSSRDLLADLIFVMLRNLYEALGKLAYPAGFQLSRQRPLDFCRSGDLVALFDNSADRMSEFSYGLGASPWVLRVRNQIAFVT